MNKKQVSKKNVWVKLSIISSLIYIGWRIFFTIPLNFGVVSMIMGIALVTAEAVGVMEAFVHYRNMSHAKAPELPVIPEESYPSVDVLIATHSESVDLLYKTVNGCKHMKYPDMNKVRIFICDDSDRPEMKQLAEELGVEYFGLSENKFAKAGNLNNALGKTSAPLIVTFDADMIPTHNFLMETVPYFSLPIMIKDEETNKWRLRKEDETDENYKIGFIQTPQSFYNADMFQFNFFAEKNIPNEQDYFFREVNVGRNRTNSAIYAGSNTVISREALEAVGGIKTGTITEDFATGMLIQGKGYSCYATPKALAHGLSPNDFKSLIKQRQRWGRGCVQTLKNFNFLFSDLPLGTKFSYVSCFLYWWTFLRRFIYIVSPIMFVLFDIVAVECSLKELVIIWLPSYMIYNHSLKVLSGDIRDQKWSNIVDTIIFPYMIIPIFAETIGIKLNKFIVTSKEKVTARNAELTYALPHIFLAVVTIVALYNCIYEMFVYKSFGNIILAYWISVNLYFLLMSIIFMRGRVNFRGQERFYAKIPVKVSTETSTFNGVIVDISEGGFAIVFEGPEYIPSDTTTEFTLTTEEYTAVVLGSVKHVGEFHGKWKYSVKISQMTKENKNEYLQIVFDRDHTLATSIQSNVVTDVSVAVKGHSKSPETSNRKLPRIPMHANVSTADGYQVTIINFNYEYILLKDFSKQTVDLVLENGLIISCILEPKISNNSKNLYIVQNKENILTDERLRDFLYKNLGLDPTTNSYKDKHKYMDV